MSFFKQVEGEAAVIVQNSVFSQVDIYTRNGYLYAKTGGGFVRLLADGSTSKSKCRLDFLSFEEPLYRDAFGRLCTANAEGPKVRRLEPEKSTLLLGAPS